MARKKLKDGIINDSKHASRSNIVLFYKEQFKKMNKLGIGKLTENGVVVTQELMDITEKRLGELEGKRSVCGNCGG